MDLETALKVVRAAGLKVSKPRQTKKQARVGPTCVARFADGTITRMTTHCPGGDDKPDWARGQRLAVYAWSARHRADSSAAPPIASVHFERDGKRLGPPRTGFMLYKAA